MPSTNTPQRRSAQPKPPPPPKPVNGTPRTVPPPPVEPRKIIVVTFRSDLPLEQAAYEDTVKILGYAPLIYPYVDEEHDEVCRRYRVAREALRELSTE